MSATNTERTVRDAVSSRAAIALPIQAIRGAHDRVDGVLGHASRTAPVGFVRARIGTGGGGGCRSRRGPSDSQPAATDTEDRQRPGSDGEGAITAWATRSTEPDYLCAGIHAEDTAISVPESAIRTLTLWNASRAA